MSMSDCQHCWNTPCTCGWGYRYWDIAGLQELKDILDMVIRFKVENPNAKFLYNKPPVAEDDKKFLEYLRANRKRSKHERAREEGSG